jgi:PIN domain nuclease of toxin-antitoxin system
VKYLLDSHTLLWYTLNDLKLSSNAKSLILDPANEILISPASYWEIAIKISIGKLTLHQPYEDFINVCLEQYRFGILPIQPEHTAVLIRLPFHHRDPFDRLLISQSMVEGISVIGNDPDFDLYPIKRLW